MSETAINEPKAEENKASEHHEINDESIKKIKEGLSSITKVLREKSPEDSDLWQTAINEKDQLTAFIRDTLGAMADDIEMGEKTYVKHDEVYFWMTYFFLQFCGFRIFLENVEQYANKGQRISEVAQILVKLIDELADTSPNLQLDSDTPEQIAKNLLGQLSNSNLLSGASDKTTNEGVVGKHLDELIEKMPSMLKLSQKTTKKQSKIEFIEKKSGKEETIMGADIDNYLLKLELDGMDEFQVEEETQEKVEIDETKRGGSSQVVGIDGVAEEFISKLIMEAKEKAKKRSKVLKCRDAIDDDSEVGPLIVFKRWPKTFELPTIDNFSIKTGQSAICDIINEWILEEDWHHSHFFLMAQSDECSDCYFYEVKFSLPTQLYPVPQVTAGIIFILEVSRIKPGKCPIQVKYKLEGSGLVHTPGEYVFQESWLTNILKSKLALFKKLRF